MDYVDAALRTFFQIHTDRPAGDVLIFLPGESHRQYELISVLIIFPGQEDIESLEKSIELYANRLPTQCMPVRVGFMRVLRDPDLQ